MCELILAHMEFLAKDGKLEHGKGVTKVCMRKISSTILLMWDTTAIEG